MTEMQYALGGAEMVKIGEQNRVEFAVVWYGGVTVNVWTLVEGQFEEIDVFSVSDEKGRPLGRDEMEVQMEQYVELVAAGIRGGSQ